MQRQHQSAICGLCGNDCSGQSHIRDANGMTFCEGCFDEAVTRKLASPMTPRLIQQTTPSADKAVESAPPIARVPAEALTNANERSRPRWPAVMGTTAWIITFPFVLFFAFVTIAITPARASDPEMQGLSLLAVWMLALTIWHLIAAMRVRLRIGAGMLLSWSVLVLSAWPLFAIVGFGFAQTAYIEGARGWSLLGVAVLVALLVWPIFVLGWFSRGSVRDELQSWRAMWRSNGATTWPSSIGGVSACFGLLCITWPLFLLAVAVTGLAEIDDTPTKSAWIMLGVALPLLAGSVQLHRRRRSGAIIVLMWAIGMLVWAVSLVASGDSTRDERMGLAVTAVIMSIWPLFLLVFFARASLWREMRTWRTWRAGPALEHSVRTESDGRMEPDARSSWPSDIAGISLSLGLVFSGFLLFAIKMGFVFSDDPTAGRIQAISALVMLVLAAMLVVGAVQLHQQKFSGAIILQIWAVILIFWATLIGAFGVIVVPVRGIWLASVAMAFLMAAWPVFLIVWFARGSITEEVRSWRRQKREHVGDPTGPPAT